MKETVTLSHAKNVCGSGLKGFSFKTLRYILHLYILHQTHTYALKLLKSLVL